MALRTSALVGGFVCTGICASADGIVGCVVGGGRFRSLLKCSAQCLLCTASLVIDFPLLSFTGFICVDLFPDGNLVV